MKKIITAFISAITIFGFSAPVFAAAASSTHQASTVKAAAHGSSKVLLRGTVTQIGNGTITITRGKSAKTYTIEVGSASLFNKAGKTVSANDIQVGDKIRARGILKGTTLSATSIRDLAR